MNGMKPTATARPRSPRADGGQDDQGKAFNRRRREWFSGVRAGVALGKSWATMAVAHVIAFDVLRGPGFVTNMSTAGMAEALETSRQVVERAVAALEAAGYLIVHRGQGRGKAHSYDLAFPPGFDRGDEGEKGNSPVASSGPRKGNSPVASSEHGHGRAEEEKATHGLLEKATAELQEKATGGLPLYKGTEVYMGKTPQGSSPNIHVLSATSVEDAREHSPDATGSTQALEAPAPPVEDDLLREFRTVFPSACVDPDKIRPALTAALDAGFRPREIVQFATSYSEAAAASGFTPMSPAAWLENLVAGGDDD